MNNAEVIVRVENIKEVKDTIEALVCIARCARALLKNIDEFESLEAGAGEYIEALRDALNVMPEFEMPE